MATDNPAALSEHHPSWAPRAAALLTTVRGAFDGLAGAGEAAVDHIGSTAVPGLAAKPYLDLQVRITPLPSHEELTPRLATIGFQRAFGSRPDSPGVDRDIPRGDKVVPDGVWEKRLYFSSDEGAILHIRHTDSPFGRYTVWFRDWLRADPEGRRRYEETKRHLSALNAGKSDYDDYTRAKTASLDEAQPQFTAWARTHRD